jgi:hypothetical protein
VFGRDKGTSLKNIVVLNITTKSFIVRTPEVKTLGSERLWVEPGAYSASQGLYNKIFTTVIYSLVNYLQL